MEEKYCSTCKATKSVSEFHKNRSEKDGYQLKCKPCVSEYKKKRYWENHDAELAKMTKSRLKPENVLQRKEYYKKNKQGYIDRYNSYKSDPEKYEKRKKSGAERYLKNKEQIAKRHQRNYYKEESKIRRKKIHEYRKVHDIQYNIKRRLRFRLRHILKAIGNNKEKNKSALQLLGCSLEYFKGYIEGKFQEGMNWELLMKGEIHIDHIKPCSWFDLTLPEEQEKCFHYTNMQPLWKADNLSKNNRHDLKVA